MGSKHVKHVNTLHGSIHADPVPGKDNKFVITEKRAWFMPIGDNQSSTTLVQMLACVLQIDLDDDVAVEAVDAQLERGRILLGYVSGESGRVAVHSLVYKPDIVVQGRVAEVFYCG